MPLDRPRAPRYSSPLTLGTPTVLSGSGHVLCLRPLTCRTGPPGVSDSLLAVTASLPVLALLAWSELGPPEPGRLHLVTVDLVLAGSGLATLLLSASLSMDVLERSQLRCHLPAAARPDQDFLPEL